MSNQACPAGDEAARSGGEGPRLDFARPHRLLKRRQFLAAYDRGQRGHGRLVVVFACPRPAAEAHEPWRLGLTVTRKVAKRAVVRNRLRRRAREYFRLRGPQLPPGWDFVVNFKGAALAADSAALHADLERTLARLGFGPDGSAPPRGQEDK